MMHKTNIGLAIVAIKACQNVKSKKIILIRMIKPIQYFVAVAVR